MMNLFVIVSGLPASGKSTLARKISAALALDYIDKDDFLERLFDANVVCTPSQRRFLSHQADMQLVQHARQLAGGVLVSWWKHPGSNADSGTPVGWLGDLPGTMIEVHCLCAPVKAAERFLGRKRHPAHLDSRWSRRELIAQFSEQAAHGPIFSEKAMCVRTDDSLSIDDIAERVLRRIAGQTCA